MADLGAVTYSAVVWTAGDVITEAKMDNMVANDQAYDSHSAQGLLLNNEKALAGKDSAGASQNIVKINSSDEVVGGYNQVGWVEAGETWVFGAIDAPSFTFTIAGVDLTTKYSAGMKVKYTNDGSVKFGFITKVVFSTNTTITIYGGTDYALVDAAITLPFYSTQKAPLDFPLDPDKWTEETVDTTARTQATPTASTYYNWFNLSIPIGSWYVSWTAVVHIDDVADKDVTVYASLSDANNTASDSDFTVMLRTTSVRLNAYLGREKALTIGSKEIHYLNIMTPTADVDNIRLTGTAIPSIIRAVCAYL